MNLRMRGDGRLTTRSVGRIVKRDCRGAGAGGGCASAHAAACLWHAHAGGGRGPAGDSGDCWGTSGSRPRSGIRSSRWGRWRRSMTGRIRERNRLAVQAAASRGHAVGRGRDRSSFSRAGPLVYTSLSFWFHDFFGMSGELFMDLCKRFHGVILSAVAVALVVPAGAQTARPHHQH